MRNVSMCVVACAFTLSVQAQQPKEHSMTGCLEQGSAPNTYMVTNVEGSGPKSIGIVSSTADLTPHVGHKVAITGTAVPSKDAEVDTSVPKAPHYMKVTAVKMISATCP
jgi:hypothetical protein